jgi:hypothetical protein
LSYTHMAARRMHCRCAWQEKITAGSLGVWLVVMSCCVTPAHGFFSRPEFRWKPKIPLPTEKCWYQPKKFGYIWIWIQ